MKIKGIITNITIGELREGKNGKYRRCTVVIDETKVSTFLPEGVWYTPLGREVEVEYLEKESDGKTYKNIRYESIFTKSVPTNTPKVSKNETTQWIKEELALIRGTVLAILKLRDKPIPPDVENKISIYADKILKGEYDG